jgi:hypothetical protein
MPIATALSLLAATAVPSVAPEPSVAKPEVVTFGASVAAMQSALEPHCSSAELREFDPPRLPMAKESHSQIDCQGFEFLGEPRLAEFVFADDSLVLVWVLVDADDQDRTIAAMREHYAGEGLTVEGAIAFPEHRTAWRFEPPEVLFYSEAVAPMFEARFLSH